MKKDFSSEKDEKSCVVHFARQNANQILQELKDLFALRRYFDREKIL